MILDAHARAELLATFQQELGEHCQALSRAFLALEKEPETAEQQRLLDEAFRSAHSLKGAARSVGLLEAEALAHGLEGVLGMAKRGERELTAALFDLLYAVVDALGNTSGGDGEPAVLGSSDGSDGSESLAGDPRRGPAPAGAVVDASADANAPDARVEALLGALRAAQAGHLRDEPSPAPPILPAPPASPTKTAAPTAIAAPRASVVGDSGHVTGGAGGAGGAGVDRAAETVRLPAARLDAVLEQLGELVVPRLETDDALAALAALRLEVDDWRRDWRKARPRLRQLERESRLPGRGPLGGTLECNEAHLASLAAGLAALAARLAGANAQFGALTQELQNEVKRLRMLPFDSLAGSLERAVRDLARQLGKEARLMLVGTDTTLDRRVLEAMKDPLLHLLRNALDHGIESPAERQQRGKARIGSLVVTASQQGEAITIEVEDDGAGLDVNALRRVAAERGLITEAERAAMSDREASEIIFLPGFSTRGAVSTVSGRGVGLDVVARNVERLGGRVEVTSTISQGTRFVMTLPLTLATTRAVLVEAAGAQYALPTSAVERILRPERLGMVGGQVALEDDAGAIPVVSLAELLAAGAGSAGHSQLAPGAATTLALVAVGMQRVALAVDRVVGEQEIVVKPLGYPLVRVRAIAGATILGSGDVVPILNDAQLVRAAARTSSTFAPAARAPAEPEPRRPRVLIADDSLTTRMLERYILEAAGYEVGLAGDGAEALALLQEGTCDLLVSDVDMPRLDGIGLTTKLRQEPRFRELPVILVTSLESAQDRERGLQAGANAYIVKSAFDQDHLLQAIRELV